MSILSDFEDRVASAVEGLFAGAFRSPVQPAELAKALGKAMDNDRMVGVGKVYAPVTYTVALSPEDMENLRGFAPVLAGELATFLAERARENDYHLSARPQVKFIEHADLRLGRYRVAAEHVSPEQMSAPAVEPDVGGAAAGVRSRTTLDTVTMSETGHDIALRGERMVIGRLKECEICLADANASRRHAELTRKGDDWHVSDLGSTNGTKVNGRPADDIRLHDGDVIEIGVTRLTYHRSGR